MSVLVMCKGLADPLPGFAVISLDALTRAESHLDALREWSEPSAAGWSALTAMDGRPWDDHIGDCLGREDDAAPPALVARLWELARQCEQVAIWYAGFADDIDVVTTPRAFADAVERQLRCGSDEPSCRMVRSLAR